MSISNKGFTCGQVNEIDMVDYLSSSGYSPEKVRNNNHWYLSPLRNERTASFKVNRSKNVWYDHGTGKGGNMVDFAILYYRCSVSEFLAKFDSNPPL